MLQLGAGSSAHVLEVLLQHSQPRSLVTVVRDHHARTAHNLARYPGGALRRDTQQQRSKLGHHLIEYLTAYAYQNLHVKMPR